MDERTRSFTRTSFARYYRDVLEPSGDPSVAVERLAGAGIPEVPGLEEREFGLIPFDEPFPEDVVMKRHLSFDRKSLAATVIEEAPAHVYISGARYLQPSARRMEEKGWLGADLVFDLDMDHLTDAPSSYPDMLDAVRDETVKLVTDFLMGDLGVTEEELLIAFSGGRGYHVHVYSDEFFDLEGRARRQIVDYVEGDISPEIYLKRGRYKKTGLGIPPAGRAGWGGRLNSAARDLLEEIKNSNSTLARLRGILDDFGEVNVGEKTAETVAEIPLSKVEEGFFDPSNVSSRKVLDLLLKAAARRAGAEVDEPVTSDVHRLMRLPGSLHGGSGLRVTPLSLDELEDFDPLNDAVAFNDDSVLVRARADIEVSLRGNRLEIGEGEETELPRYAAVFAGLRGGVEVK